MKELVLDIGGSAIKYALMDQQGNFYEKGSKITPLDTLDSLLTLIVELYEQYQQQIEGIAISLPGNIDSETGQIFAAGALLYNTNVNFIKELKKRIDTHIAIENDGKCAALAEVWKGNLKDCQDGIVLILGTGVGGGIIINRKLVKGHHFFAGEVSYLMMNFNDFDFHNVFAMKGSTSALLMKVAELKGIDSKELDGKKVFKWMEEGDKEALLALDEMTSYIAGVIYNLQCVLDTQRVLIGGGVSKQKRLLFEIQRKLDMIYEQVPFTIPHAQVTNCAYYNDSNLLGAYYHYQQQFGGITNE